MSNASPILEVDGLHAGYGRAEVLHGLSLHVRQGSVVAVIGPNGAGKSTLLNALIGQLAQRGSIRFDGHDIGGLALEQRVDLGIALVPERRELFGSMSVADNLLLGSLQHRRRSRAERGGELDRVLELFPRLKERYAQTAGTLSGGERQMLAVGRALMGRPRLLMLDEPSLGLAPLVTLSIFEALAELRRIGTSILLVEQNARAALGLADQAFVLEAGEIVLQGRAQDLARDPKVVASYLGAQAAAAPDGRSTH